MSAAWPPQAHEKAIQANAIATDAAPAATGAQPASTEVCLWALESIACMACSLEQQLIAALEADDQKGVLYCSRYVAVQIGMLADTTIMSMGLPGHRGAADNWILSPAHKASLDRMRGGR